MKRYTIAIFAALVAGAAVTPLRAQQAAAPKSVEEKLRDAAGMSRAKGSETATVHVYELADFQCPFCGQFAMEVMGKIDSAFIKTGKVQWVYVNLPLPMHPNAFTAAEAAMCSGVTGKFWQMHDKLYKNQAEWSQSTDPAPMFARYAKEIGVAAEPYTSCTMGDKVSALIINDVMFGAAARINGTPTFVINDTESVIGNKTFEEWKEILEAAIKKAAAKK